MTTECRDPRHATPCPNPHTCPGCQDECDPVYWLEPEAHGPKCWQRIHGAAECNCGVADRAAVAP